jgi:hypothetical protein
VRTVPVSFQPRIFFAGEAACALVKNRINQAKIEFDIAHDLTSV